MTITVSTGPAAASVPDVVGLTQSDARGQLQTAGFTVQVKTRDSQDRGDDKIVLNRGQALSGTDTASVIQINYPFSFMYLNPVVRLVTPGSSTGQDPITMTSSAIMRNEM